MPSEIPQSAMKIAEEKSIKAHRAGLCAACARRFSAGDPIVTEWKQLEIAYAWPTILLAQQEE